MSKEQNSKQKSDSHANHSALNDNRYLWPEMFDKEIKPEFVIGENVQGFQDGM